jgi:hypothetical protein
MTALSNRSLVDIDRDNLIHPSFRFAAMKSTGRAFWNPGRACG